MARNKKVVKYKKPLQINIGIIIFVFIFLYMMYFIFQYFITDRVPVIEVEKGTISQNKNYTGFVIRDEKVYNAEENGYINYFTPDGTKAGLLSYVYTIDQSGEFYNSILQSKDGKFQLDHKYLDKLEESTYDFISDYSNSAFYKVHDFKFNLDAEIREGITQVTFDEDYLANNGENIHIYKAKQDGIVVYNVDGYEKTTIDNFTKAVFDQSSYKKNSLLGKEKVQAGEPVYKMVNSEKWDIIIPISKKLAKTLQKEEYIKIKFKKDSSITWANCEIMEKGKSSFLKLNLEHSMIRFISERYLELELLLKDSTGLKIPNTALVEKKFFVIPKEYISKGGNSMQDGIIKETITEDGKKTEFIPVSLFYETEEGYYISHESLEKGDVLIMPESTDKFTLSNTASLTGVYNLNKGYAIFRRIETITKNKEYTLIKEGTKFGISLFDHIALDSSTINEDEIVK